MKIIHRKEDQKILKLLLEGSSLDVQNTLFFKRRALEILQETECTDLVIDMQKLTFIDSSGLSSLISLCETLRSKGGSLKLSSPTPSIRTVFELVCMQHLFEN